MDTRLVLTFDYHDSRQMYWNLSRFWKTFVASTFSYFWACCSQQHRNVCISQLHTYQHLHLSHLPRPPTFCRDTCQSEPCRLTISWWVKSAYQSVHLSDWGESVGFPLGQSASQSERQIVMQMAHQSDIVALHCTVSIRTVVFSQFLFKFLNAFFIKKECK